MRLCKHTGHMDNSNNLSVFEIKGKTIFFFFVKLGYHYYYNAALINVVVFNKNFQYIWNILHLHFQYGFSFFWNDIKA